MPAPWSSFAAPSPAQAQVAGTASFCRFMRVPQRSVDTGATVHVAGQARVARLLGACRVMPERIAQTPSLADGGAR